LQCPSCGQQTEEGKFCTNCGAPLHQNESAAANEPIQQAETHQPQPNQHQQITQQQETQATPQAAPNEAVEKIKEVSNNFSNFFMTLLKKPSAAKQANKNDWISSVITMVIYALVFALGYFFAAKSLGSSVLDRFGGFGDFFEDTTSTSIPFTEGFLWPFLKIAIMIALSVAITFIVLKLATSDFNFLDTIGKFGAYLMPFTLLLVLGYILVLIKLHSVGAVILFASFLAIVLIIPTILLMEEKSVGVDRIYLMVLTSVINLGIFFYLIAPFILPVFVLGGVDSIMDDFGF